MLGHLAEGLSFILPRTDARLRLMQQGASGPHKRPLRYYFERNFVIGTSGHFTTSALANVQAETPIEMLTYADDYRA